MPRIVSKPVVLSTAASRNGEAGEGRRGAARWGERTRALKVFFGVDAGSWHDTSDKAEERAEEAQQGPGDEMRHANHKQVLATRKGARAWGGCFAASKWHSSRALH